MSRVVLVLVVLISGGLYQLEGVVIDHPHPRIWMTETGMGELEKRLESDPLAASMQLALIAKADEVVESRTTRYEIPDGRRLLRESRLALANISHCAWAWRFTGKDVYRQRAIDEMEAACGMSDWNPSHFLDTAEMALAVGWGYDWLHDSLTPDQRSRFSQALVDKGLRPARLLFEGNAWWTSPKNNWAQVCGGGIAIAAAAVYEKDPELAASLIESGLGLVKDCHRLYMPDGMYPEGPGYWQYGTMYHVKLLAACETLGIPFKRDDVLRKSGRAMIHLEGPSGLSFNFADGSAKRSMPSAAQCWIARSYQDPAQISHVRRKIGKGIAFHGNAFRSYGGPLSLLWLPEESKSAKLSTFASFEGEQPVAVFRTSWEPDGSWLAIKGGAASVSHGQMDIGSFVYDAHGVRWFHDLGPDSYGLKGYFGDQRWEYFRLQNRSHSTLEIADRLQNPDAAVSPMVSSGIRDGIGFAKFDLSPAYQNAATNVTREVSFDRKSGGVRLVDTIAEPQGKTVWRAFTDAGTRAEGNRVVLSKDGRSISVWCESEHGVWTVGEATPPTSEENPNHGFRQISLRVPAGDLVRIAVRIEP